MEDFESAAGSIVVVGFKKIGLRGESDGFQAESLAPTDEVGE